MHEAFIFRAGSTTRSMMGRVTSGTTGDSFQSFADDFSETCSPLPSGPWSYTLALCSCTYALPETC